MESNTQNAALCPMARPSHEEGIEGQGAAGGKLTERR